MKFNVHVEVRTHPGIANPEGATIERALPALGFHDVSDMVAGRSFTFQIDALDRSSAFERATLLADRLLANPVIEESQIRLDQVESPDL